MSGKKETKATKVICGTAGIQSVYESVDRPKNFMQQFEKQMNIRILNSTNEEVQFEISGIDAALANTFRRVLLSETPTMAFEKVFIKNNTSIMQDEVLAHRLGLLPILVDPDEFEYVGEDGHTHEDNTLVFKLQIKCTEEDMQNVEVDVLRENATAHKVVYSRAVKWQDKGDQKKKFAGNPPRMVHDNIVVNKLRPNQEIDVVLHAHKGVGKTHAKFSPVSTAYYRMMPFVNILKPITGADAKALRDLCPTIFEVDKTGTLLVAHPENCTHHPECFRDRRWADKIELGRIRDRFIFSIESTGIMPAAEIFRRALSVFAEKCRGIKSSLEGLSKE